MIDPFVVLTPVLILAVMALLRFVGCDALFGIPAIPVPVDSVGFSPLPGGYFNTQPVSLSQDQGAVISFTTSDTGSPDQPYAGPILVSATTTIRATASKDGGNSGVQSAKYLIGPIMFQPPLLEFDDQTGTPTAQVTTAPFMSPNPINQSTLIVVWIWYKDVTNGTVSVLKVEDPQGNSYQSAVGPTTQGTFRQEIWYGTAPLVATGFTVTATFAQQGSQAPFAFPDEKAISAHLYLNASPGDPLDTPLTDTNAAATTDVAVNVATGLLKTANARLVFAAALFTGSTIPSVGAGFQQRSTLGGNLTEDRDIPTPGQTVQGTFQNPGGAPWIAQVCAFK
jgi:hypothetical protein